MDARIKSGHDDRSADTPSLTICDWRKPANHLLDAKKGQRRDPVSRHHILPPIIYTPAPPKLKETKRRRGVGYSEAAGDVDETEEAGEVSNTGSAKGSSALPQHQRPIEATERRLHSPNGNLSDGTLKAMLEVQELEGEQGVSGASPTKDE